MEFDSLHQGGQTGIPLGHFDDGIAIQDAPGLRCSATGKREELGEAVTATMIEQVRESVLVEHLKKGV